MSYYDWPAYTATPLYDRDSTGELEEVVHTLATVWFDDGAHRSTTMPGVVATSARGNSIATYSL